MSQGCGCYSQKCSISNLSRNGGTWTHPKHHHPVPQGPPSTGSPPAIPLKPHSCRNTQLLHSQAATPPAKELTSFSLGAEQHPHHIHFTPSSRPVWYYRTGVHCLINWHVLTLYRPRKHLAVFKDLTVLEPCPPIAEVLSFAPSERRGLVMPCPTGGNKTSNIAHGTHCRGHAYELN
jgi:hypothetical protein